MVKESQHSFERTSDQGRYTEHLSVASFVHVVRWIPEPFYTDFGAPTNDGHGHVRLSATLNGRATPYGYFGGSI